MARTHVHISYFWCPLVTILRRFADCLPRTTYHSPLTTHYSLPTTHHSLLTTHYPLLTTHYSLLTTHCPLLTTHYSLPTTHYSLLTTHYSLPTTHYSLLIAHYSLRTTHYPLLIAHYSLRTTHCLGPLAGGMPLTLTGQRFNAMRPPIKVTFSTREGNASPLATLTADSHKGFHCSKCYTYACQPPDTVWLPDLRSYEVRKS